MFNVLQYNQKNLFNIDKKLQLLIKEVLKISPYDFDIVSGYRTLKKQKELFNRGISKYDGIKKVSKHQEGKAIDIICYNEISIITHDERYYISVSEVFKQKAKELKIKIKWGGDRKNFKDYSHFELI